MLFQNHRIRTHANLTIMLIRILQSPIVDAILIILAIRFLWPALFGIKRRKPIDHSNQRQKNFVNEPPPAEKSSKDRTAKGEYIDYEEIK